jgi:hypothetical protein
MDYRVLLVPIKLIIATKTYWTYYTFYCNIVIIKNI